MALPTADHIEAIRQIVVSFEQGVLTERIKAALDDGLLPEDIINQGLIMAMDIVGREFSAGNIFVPEMLMAATTMKEGLEVVKPLLKEGAGRGAGEVMLATVKGDLHDIGKNILGMMLEGGGFSVYDLGINVDTNEIVRQVRERKSPILGLSALLTTTMPEMKRVIERLKQENLREQVRVVVGGAPLSAKFAQDIGADGYAPDAADAVNLCRRLMEGMEG